jgi:hypothetical protein
MHRSSLFKIQGEEICLHKKASMPEHCHHTATWTRALSKFRIAFPEQTRTQEKA